MWSFVRSFVQSTVHILSRENGDLQQFALIISCGREITALVSIPEGFSSSTPTPPLVLAMSWSPMWPFQGPCRRAWWVAAGKEITATMTAYS